MEEKSSNHEENKAAASEPPAEAPQIDWLLQELVFLVNKFDLRIGVTLTVGGNLLSGEMIGGAHYFKTMKENFAQSKGASEIGKSISVAMERYEGNFREYMAQDETTPPAFIHLLEAKLHGPNTVPGSSTIQSLWRGRLSEVSGFTIGVLEAKTLR